MDSAVDIIEALSDGKYRLNEYELKSIVSKAHNCDDFALISIIGPRYSGKSFFMNCLVSYLESEDQANWPRGCVIEYRTGFRNDYTSNTPVIQMWSKPFILEVDGHKRAVFLMDSSHVIETNNCLSSTKVAEELIRIFLTSSTVIYNQSHTITEMSALTKMTAKLFGINNSLQEMFYLIHNWDRTPDKGFKEYSFGLRGGERYLRDQAQFSELNKYFENIECCLLPCAGSQLNRMDVNFDELNTEFQIEFSQLIKYRLLNIDEMQVKKDSKSGRCLKPKELVDLFQSYVNKLNGDSVCLDFGLKSVRNALNEKMNDISDSTQDCQQTNELYQDLNERYENTVKAIEEVINSGKQLLQRKSAFISQTKYFGSKSSTDPIFTDSRYQFGSGQTYSQALRTGEIASKKDPVVTENANDVSEQLINKMEKLNISDEESSDWYLESAQKQNNKPTYASVASSNIDHLHRYKHGNGNIPEPMDVQQNNTDWNKDQSVKETVDNISDNLMDTSQENSTNDSSQQTETEKSSPMSSPETNPKVICDTILKFCEMLRTEYQNSTKSRINENDFNLENGGSLLHKIQKTALLKKFDDNFKSKKYNQFRDEYREILSQMIESLEPLLETEVKQILNLIIGEYDKCLEQSMVVYENRMKNTIEKEFDHKLIPSGFTQMNNECKDSIVTEFERKVKQFNQINFKIINNYKTKLRSELSKKEGKYKKALNGVTDYLNEWKKAFETDRCFENILLVENHTIFKRKLNSSEDLDLNSLISKITDKLFEKIRTQNKMIKDKEKDIIEHNMSAVIEKFWKQFNNKLNSGFYNALQVKQMFDKLLNYAINSVERIFDLKPQQNNLIIHLKNQLKCKIESEFAKNNSNYSKKSIEAKSYIETTIRDSIALYMDLTNKSLSQKTSLKLISFETISSGNKQVVLTTNRQRLESIKSDFNKEFFDHILKGTEDSILTKIGKYKEILVNKYVDQGTIGSNSSSFAIYFSRFYLFAGIYDTEFHYILDKSENICYPNCIVFSDEILLGYEAINHIQSFGKEALNSFDIKNLLLKKKSDFNEEELNSYPFEFSETPLKVKVQNKISYEFSIESMIALQVLQIKSNAEKQFGNNITKGVFTVPTHFTIRKRNAFKDVAAIAGLESVHIMSEITAAAIGYSHEVKPQTEIKVLFVAINDFECDAAVCRLYGNKIEYLCYANENLTSYEKKGWKIWQSDPRPDEKMKICSNKLFDKLIKRSLLNKKQIDDIVLVGASKIVGELKKHISSYFESKTINDCTQTDIVVKGSALFCKSITENNSDISFDITEVAFHTLEYEVREAHYIYPPKILITAGSKLPSNKNLCMNQIYKNDLPIHINITNKKALMAQFIIKSLSNSYLMNSYIHFNHQLIFHFNNLGELNVSSQLTSKDRNIENNLIEIKLGLTADDINRDKQHIQLFDRLFNESKIEIEKKLTIDKSRNELETKFLEIKKRLQSNTELGRLKRKKVEEQLKKTETLLARSDSELKTFTNQINLLEDMIKTLNI